MKNEILMYFLIYLLGVATVLSTIGIIAIRKWYAATKKEEREEEEGTKKIKKTA